MLPEFRGVIVGRPAFGPVGLFGAPVVDGLADGFGGEVAAQHFLFGDAAKIVGNVLLGDFVSDVDRLTEHEFRCSR